MILIEGITKKYGENTVINNFSLTINDGEKAVLMGNSGIGKTTLLRLIANFESVNEGRISVSGKIAYMFQEPRLLLWKNALENVKAVLSSDKFHLAEKYLEAVNLLHSAEKKPDELSGGMAQRVAFARFLAFAEANDTDILLLDEPFSALDKDSAEEMTLLLKRFSENRTLVLITHDKHCAELMGGKIIEMT